MKWNALLTAGLLAVSIATSTAEGDAVNPTLRSLSQGSQTSSEQRWLTRRATLTAYCPCLKCCGKTDKITASGKLATQSNTIAAPRSIPFGTRIAVKMDADIHIIGEVEDRGGAIKDHGDYISLDLYFNTHEEALEFGIMKNILILIEVK